MRRSIPVVVFALTLGACASNQGAEANAAMTDEEHLSTAEAYKRTLGLTMGPVMATMSGKAHRKNRGVVAPVFDPQAMRALVDPVFRVEADELADQLSGEGQVDLVRHFTRRFTFNVITRLLGLPVDDVDTRLARRGRVLTESSGAHAYAGEDRQAQKSPSIREESQHVVPTVERCSTPHRGPRIAPLLRDSKDRPSPQFGAQFLH